MRKHDGERSDRLLEAAAIAIYDTDEDITDENIVAAPHGHQAWNEGRYPRLQFAQLDSRTQDAYRRRARAAFAAAAYLQNQDEPSEQDYLIVIGKRRFNLVEVL